MRIFLFFKCVCPRKRFLPDNFSSLLKLSQIAFDAQNGTAGAHNVVAVPAFMQRRATAIGDLRVVGIAAVARNHAALRSLEVKLELLQEFSARFVFPPQLGKDGERAF